MNAYELEIKGLEAEGTDIDGALAALRWELFVCREITDVRRTGTHDVVAIVHVGESPDVARWLETLGEAGYEASTRTSGASSQPDLPGLDGVKSRCGQPTRVAAHFGEASG